VRGNEQFVGQKYGLSTQNSKAAAIALAATAAFTSIISAIIGFKLIQALLLLRKTMGDLRAEMSERQKMLAELVLRSEELKKSNAELEQFAHSASHDLQEPIRMITSYLKLLENNFQCDLPNKARQYLSTAITGARRMQKLVQDVLAFCRFDRDPDFPLAPQSSAAAVQAAIENLECPIKEAGAQVEITTLPEVPIEQERLIRVFQNLIGNAVKYRSEQPPVVRISAVRVGVGWKFSVKDNGIGIASHDQQRIFSLFERLHGSEIVSGSGIGLATCKKIVEKVGGSIWVESESGHGSNFHFIIPDRGNSK
jgi:light-regulated signal transduction histidine kinase (bacteriophytochrome)